MTKAYYKNVKISGVSTVVPQKTIALDDELHFYNNDSSKIEKLKNTIGLSHRSIVDDKTTPADLMEYAGEKLIEGMQIDKKTIDAIICVLDYPDYKCPPTSCVLHGKLNLANNCMALDINHGCAGYVYGLNVASALIQSGGCKKILLLVGDTKTKTINIKDRICAPIFGDGASATILEYSSEETASYFLLGADGSKFENIIIPAGGARLPCSLKTAKEVTDEFGNVKSLENFTMNGRNVFDFTMNFIPNNIKEVMEFANITANDIDYAILHQANKSIINNIALKAGFKDLNKVPTQTLAKYGNLAVASIPSVINDCLSSEISKKKKKVLLSGFGVGLAFASAIIELNNIYATDVLKYEEK